MGLKGRDSVLWDPVKPAALSKKGLLHAYVGEMDDALDFVLAKGEME